jgi:hypothetical protein
MPLATLPQVVAAANDAVVTVADCGLGAYAVSERAEALEPGRADALEAGRGGECIEDA